MIHFEKAVIEDSEKIAEIKKCAYNDETRRFGPGRDGGPTGYDSVEENRRLINTFPVYKIMLEDKIIGCFWMNKEGEQHYELEDICIHPEHHNKGYGTKAMELIENQFIDISKWTLGTPHYSVRNQHLYEKMGYKKIAVTEDGFLFLYEKKRG